jgi:hypothetical protein
MLWSSSMTNILVLMPVLSRTLALETVALVLDVTRMSRQVSLTRA